MKEKKVDLIAFLENGIAIYAPNSEFANQRLQELTKRIQELTIMSKRNLFEIAMHLATIKNEELYKSAGFLNVSDYAEKCFGYKSAMTYKLISVADKYIECKCDENGMHYISSLASESADYTVSQLMELDSIEPDIAKSLNDRGIITPDKPTKEIRSIVKRVKKGEIDENGQPIKSESSNNEKSDNNVKIFDLFNGTISGEFDAIIQHCSNLLNNELIANNEKIAKRLNAFIGFCTKTSQELNSSEVVEKTEFSDNF